MIYHSNLEQGKLYAVTSLSNDKKMQLVWIHLNAYDNDFQHFWSSFLTGLSAWNVQFTQNQRQKKAPRTKEEINAFTIVFSEKLKENPLIIAVTNSGCIKKKEVHYFLKALVQIKELFLIQVYTEDGAYNQKELLSNKPMARHVYMTPEEEQKFYKDSNITLSDKELSEIRRFTDGWPSAVQEASNLIQLHGHSIFENLEQYLLQWLELVFFRKYTQPEIHRLICLSLLDGFTLELIQHLIDWSGEALEQVMEDSPIIRYDETNKYYTYAKYFQPFLKERQVLLSNKQKQDFYLHIADWNKERGKRVEAITCYRRAGANKKILQVMSQWTFPASRELANCYVDTINEMPESFLQKNPLLYVIRSHMLSTLYRYQDANQLIETFCHAFDQGSDTPEELRPTLGEGYLVWANTSTSLGSDSEKTFQLYKRAAELLPNGSAMIRLKMSLFSDTPVLRLKTPKPGALKKSVEDVRRIEPYLLTAMGGGWAGCTALATAEMNYYIRNFKEVDGNARKAIVEALENDQYDLACSACFLLMRFFFAKGNYEKTMEHLHMLQQLASEANYNTFFSMPELAESWFQLKLGKRNNVADWIKDESRYLKKIMPWNYGRDRIIRAFYLLADQQFEPLIAYADSSITLFQKRGYNLLNIPLFMMKAAAYHQTNEFEKMIEQMNLIYHWSHANKIIMPVVEFSNYVRPIIEICRKADSCLIPDSWLNEVEKKANSYYVYQYNIRKQYDRTQRVKKSILEELTSTEQKLLLMISRGMTAREIAEVLGKTISTVKGMSRRVYTKIGADGMADAIRIATENNIENMVML